MRLSAGWVATGHIAMSIMCGISLFICVVFEDLSTRHVFIIFADIGLPSALRALEVCLCGGLALGLVGSWFFVGAVKHQRKAIEGTGSTAYFLGGLVTLAVFKAVMFYISSKLHDAADSAKRELESFMSRYFADAFTKKAVDRLQADLRCCGVNNHSDWKLWSTTSTGSNRVPDSCYEGSAVAGSLIFHEVGCLDAVKLKFQLFSVTFWTISWMTTLLVISLASTVKIYDVFGSNREKTSERL